MSKKEPSFFERARLAWSRKQARDTAVILDAGPPLEGETLAEAISEVRLYPEWMHQSLQDGNLGYHHIWYDVDWAFEVLCSAPEYAEVRRHLLRRSVLVAEGLLSMKDSHARARFIMEEVDEGVWDSKSYTKAHGEPER